MAVPRDHIGCRNLKGLRKSKALLSRFYERTGAPKHIGSGALGRGFTGARAGTVEAPPVRGFGFRESGSPPSAAAGLCRSHFRQGQNAGGGGGNRAAPAAAP